MALSAHHHVRRRADARGDARGAPRDRGAAAGHARTGARTGRGRGELPAAAAAAAAAENRECAGRRQGLLAAAAVAACGVRPPRSDALEYQSVGDTDGMTVVTDRTDNYSLVVPSSWVRIDSAGQDVFYRSTEFRDTNLFVDVLIAKGVDKVSDLGGVKSVAAALRKRVDGESQSTRIGVTRSTSVVGASAMQKTQKEVRFSDKALLGAAAAAGGDGAAGPDEQLVEYYQVMLNSKSFASRNSMAVNPDDRPVELEWDRRLIVRPAGARANARLGGGVRPARRLTRRTDSFDRSSIAPRRTCVPSRVRAGHRGRQAHHAAPAGARGPLAGDGGRRGAD